MLRKFHQIPFSGLRRIQITTEMGQKDIQAVHGPMDIQGRMESIITKYFY